MYQHIQPKNQKLKKHIKLYYIHKSDTLLERQRITYFPNYTTTINIYKNSQVSWNEFSRTHKHNSAIKFLKLLVSKIDKSREIITEGKFKKLTIVFNPLGLNHFVDVPLSQLTEDHFSFFNHFDSSFDVVLEKIFIEDNMEIVRDLLDRFFIKNYVEFSEKRIIYAVNTILKTNGIISVEQISKELKVSRKTIFRLFKKHLSYSPSEYKSIVKFRKTLNIYQQQKDKNNFSSLAYEAFYYDQSDLNFNFKEKSALFLLLKLNNI
jgi:AraC-like DNA-binding protein